MAPTAVTRYLCAGAYLDEDFARAVLDEVVADPHRGVAPAPGVDVETVARHCLAAVRRSVRRDVVICVILLAIALTAGVRGILVVTWLCSTLLVLRSLRSLTLADLSAAVIHLLAFLVISGLCAGGLLLLAARDDNGNGPLIGLGSLSLPALIGIGFVALWATTYLDAVARFSVLHVVLTPSRFAPDPDFPVMRPVEEDRYQYIGQAQSSRLSVYSPEAPNGPFVGFGELVHAWTVGARLRSSDSRASEGAPGSGFTTSVVYSGLRDADWSLGHDRSPDPSGGGIRVGDLVAAPGWIPASHPFVEPGRGRPAASIPSAVITDLQTKQAGAEMYYTTLEMPIRDGDITVTGLVHMEVSGEHLNVDVALSVLPAVDPRYRSADAPPPATGVVLARLLARSALDLIRVVPRAPVQLVRLFRRRVARGVSGIGRESTDFGARVGVRELAGAGGARTAAADLEITRLANVISRTVVESVVGVLEGHGLESREFTDNADKVWHRPMATTTRGASSGGVPS